MLIPSNGNNTLLNGIFDQIGSGFKLKLLHHIVLCLSTVLTEMRRMSTIFLVSELEKVLRRNKFDQYLSHEERKQFLTSFILHATPVETDEIITACRDPKDNKFLELAVCGKADCIITGDADLLVLNPFRTIPLTIPLNTVRNIP